MIAEPAKAILRRERRLARLGNRTPCCPRCGETALVCLRLDHVTGHKRDPNFTEILCLNCHAKKHDQFQDADILMMREGSAKSLMIMRLRAAAETQRKQAEAFDHWADEMEKWS